jgi:serine/threonine protein kinase
MRMENFASVDSDESTDRRGLTRISPLGRRVYADWQARRDHLRSCAEVSVRRVTEDRNLNLFSADLLGPGLEEFEVLDQIGDGYFGRVFSCVHREQGLPFAIKRIKTDQLYDRESMGRFVREMRVLRTIQHPNVIRLHTCRQ